MLIVADERIPHLPCSFGQIGEVRTLPGPAIDREAIREAEVLLVRTTTRVDEALVAGSRLRFVGAASIGTDHVDQQALARHDIAFANAPGCNAVAVSEWFTAALLQMAVEQNLTLAGARLGVIGAGNTGTAVALKGEALGMTVLRNDPPRARAEGEAGFVPLAEIVKTCDVVSLHVPLVDAGADRTRGLVDLRFLRAMKETALLLNASRGEVVVEADLRTQLKKAKLAGAALDVWNREPDISLDTLGLATLATPHIAGYSADGKARATEMVFVAALKALGLQATMGTADMPAAFDPVEYRAGRQGLEGSLHDIVSQVYPIWEDDDHLRSCQMLEPGEVPAFFAGLRNDYALRREWSNTTVHVKGGGRPLREALEGLGFRLG